MKKIYTILVVSSLLALGINTNLAFAAGPTVPAVPLNLKQPGNTEDLKLKLEPGEQKVIFELYKTTLKPLTLERIENDVRLLAEQKTCVTKAENPQAFRLCDKKFLSARRDKTEEITKKVEAKRIELDKKYGLPKSTGSTADLFK